MVAVSRFFFWGTVAALVVTLLASVADADGKCVGCTLGVGLIFQMADNHGRNVVTAVNELCSSFLTDPNLATLCMFALGGIAKSLQNDYDKNRAPEDVCVDNLKMCDADNKCRLFTKWPLQSESLTFDSDYTPQPISPSLKTIMGKNISETEDHRAILGEIFDLLSVGLGAKRPNLGLDLIKLGGQAEALALAYGIGLSPEESRAAITAGPSLKPKQDGDNDGHSAEEVGRGVHWRGRDCDDANGDVYPGRRSTVLHPDVDHNCNGISGIDTVTGQSWEDIYCKDTPRYGYLALGDSATAHFGIPGDYITASKIRPGLYDNIFTLLQNEGDWPQCSGYTGYEKDVTKCRENKAGFFSIYDAMRSRNLCMHRDYANLGLNGNRVPQQPSLNEFVDRNPQHDYPVIATLNLIGNDVCNGSSDINSMTTAAQFDKDSETILRELDERLPAGSHVFISGLVDGDILFDILKNRRHPIGATYTEVYDFLLCTKNSPCAGWMNPDATIRAKTTEHGRKLTAIVPQVIERVSPSLKNIKAHFIHLAPALTGIIREWFAQGKNPAELFESVDGFHPSAAGLSLIGRHIFDYILEKVEIPVNPYNSQIASRFGDQGGH